jgi:branched-chain amino acid transport system substrate-binding protein
MVNTIRRSFTLLALAAASQSLLPSLAQAQTQAPIKVGLLVIDSGPFATYAAMIEDGARAAVDMLNAEGGALGRKFELVTQKHTGTPATALAAVSRLVQLDNVSFVIGQTPSSHSLAIAPKLTEYNLLHIDTYASADDLMTTACQPNYFRVSIADSVTAATLRAFVQKSGAKTWNVISPDYAAGHSFAKQFTQMVQSLGGNVKETLFAPLGTTDFGAYISQLNKPTEGLMVQLYMSDGNAFAKQQKQFGLFEKYKTVLGNGFATEYQASSQGDSVLGVLNTLPYHNTLPGERNAAYVKSFEARYKRKPIFFEADHMVAMEMLRAAIIKAKSTDVAAVRTALAGLKTSTIFGEVEMRAQDHQLIRQNGVAEVVKGADGKPTFMMRSIEKGAELYPPPSPACKVS